LTFFEDREREKGAEFAENRWHIHRTTGVATEVERSAS